MHRDARPDEVEARSVRLLHDADLEAELPLLDAELVRQHADGAGRVEKDHGQDSEDAQDPEALHGRLQRVEGAPFPEDLHHQELPVSVFCACAARAAAPGAVSDAVSAGSPAVR